MSELGRKRMFGGAVLLLLAAVALAAALGPRGRDLPARRSEARTLAGRGSAMVEAGRRPDGT
jgi:hypothetical protein